MVAYTRAFSQYQLQVFSVDKDSAFFAKNLPLQTSFKSKVLCLEYVYDLPTLLKTKGFINASLDSIKVDSSKTTAQLYVGNTFKWARISTKHVDKAVLESVSWNEKNFSGKPMNFDQLQQVEQRILNYMENNGYPFTKVELDSVALSDDELKANLKIDKGPLYKIDSIRVYGSAKISADFLQHYLNISNGSIYKKEKL